MKHFIFFILLLFSTASFAQDKQIFAISGSIKDTLSNRPIDGVTIAIVRAKDSSLAKITSTDKEGNFFFENLSRGTYRILCTALGYKKNYSRLLIIE
ncbi:MAG: carboxypeptidase-like regulatory domain-containing protein, partial [Chitinophagaceae bacterium]